MRKNFCISSKNQRNIPRMYIAYLRNILMYVLWTSYIHTCGNYFTYIGYAFYILFIFYVYTQNMQYVCTYHGYTLHIFGIYLCMYYEHPMYVHVVIISHTQDMNFIYFSQSMYIHRICNIHICIYIRYTWNVLMFTGLFLGGLYP